MGRTARDNRDRPHPRPVERIELNGEHVGRRLAASLVLLAFGAVLLVYAFMQLLAPETGWIDVKANSSAGVTSASEFEFLYWSGSPGESKAVASLYTEASRKAYRLFHNLEGFEGVVNVYAINRHPNEVLQVDPVLYEAFACLERYGRRELYLGPVYDRYYSVFFCQGDDQLVDYDPWLNGAVREEYGTLASYAADPGAVSLELLGGNQVRLNLSEEYLAYARREGVTNFIDFGWMKNAFIADFLAQAFTSQGYTRGVLSSYDGFVRNLDGGGTEYSLDLYARQGDVIYPAAIMGYQGALSLVNLRSYPMNALDFQRFYELENGEIRLPYVDIRDGLARCAVDTLVGYSRDKGCAEVLLEMLPVYVASGFQESSAAALAGRGIEAIYYRGSVLCHTDPALRLSDFYDKDGVRYSEALAP